MNRIRDKLILITGASSGIGQACAHRFAADGADLILWARRLERLEPMAAELEREYDIKVISTRVDVRDREGVQLAADLLIFGGSVPHVLLNNAGLAAGFSHTQEGDHRDWDRMIDTNIKGLLNVTRAFLPHMIERARGHVVNMGSTAGHMTYPRGNVYAATKAAVRSLTEGIAVDLVGTPIRVSSIDPGFVETEFSTVRFRGDELRAKEVYRGFQPLTPDDVADVIAYVINAPENVNIADVVLMPVAQRNIYVVDREE
jgi:3-hydroxy acid dehydrogenase/malonic semialdehyde reductase